jgi:hypothetical protein
MGNVLSFPDLAPKPVSKADDEGQEMQLYFYSYLMGGKTWSVDLWAYSLDDAADRGRAIRETLALHGVLTDGGGN